MGEGSYRVVVDYRGPYPDPIVMKAGEKLRVGERDDAWAWCTGSSGKSGWASTSYIRQDGDAGTALRDYSAVEPTVQTGEESGWVWARDQLGWVPLEHVERI